nr:hypothetical protein [Tanacetum cinerariifolium]
MTSVVYEKISPRSCLRWKPTGKIFITVGLKWIPTGMLFDSCMSKVNSEPPIGSNDDITNPYECDKTLNFRPRSYRQMASTDNTSGPTPQRKERCTLQCALSLKEEKSSYLRAVLSTTSIISHARSVNKTISSRLVPQPPSPTPNVPPTKNDWDTLFCLMFDEYFNPLPSVAQPVLVADVQEHVVLTSIPSSTRIDQDTPSTSTSQTIKEAQSHVIPTSVEGDDHGIEVAHMDNDLLFNAACKKALNLLKKELLIQGEAVEASKKRRSLLDHKIKLLSKGSSEGSGIIPEVPDETKDNSCCSKVTEKQDGNVQTSLTLSSAKLEIQLMVDVPIHQEDQVFQRTPLIDTIISMVTDKTTSTPTLPTTQAHVQICSTSCWKYISRGV